MLAISQNDAYLKIWLSVSCKKQPKVTVSMQLCVTFGRCNTVYLIQIVCRVQLLCIRQQRNVMKQWFNCFWIMEPTSRPGPNTYACSLCARLCTVFLMQLLHELFLAQRHLLLFCKASLQCCRFHHNCLMLLIRDAVNSLSSSALNNSPPPPDPHLTGP